MPSTSSGGHIPLQIPNAKTKMWPQVALRYLQPWEFHALNKVLDVHRMNTPSGRASRHADHLADGTVAKSGAESTWPQVGTTGRCVRPHGGLGKNGALTDNVSRNCNVGGGHAYYYPCLCDCHRRCCNDCGRGLGSFYFGHRNTTSNSFEILRNRDRNDIGRPWHAGPCAGFALITHDLWRDFRGSATTMKQALTSVRAVSLNARYSSLRRRLQPRRSRVGRYGQP
jgi:hypothetical protein